MNQVNTFIRWANVTDAADLVALNDAFNGSGATIDDVIESLATSQELVAVAVMDGVPVGFACAQYFRSFCYQTLHGEITEMYIVDMARKRGLATGLIAFLEEGLHARGVTSVKVLTGMMNEVALRTYQGSKYASQEEAVLQKELI